MKKKILLILGALAIFGGGLYFWQTRHHGAAAGAELVLYGNVEIRQADLGFNVDGPVDKILVEEGDRVTAGQTLALLDQSAYKLNVRNAEAALANAEQLLRQYVNGFRPQEIEQSRAALASAEATLQNAETTLQRNNKLVGDKYVSQSDTDAARTARDTAEALLRQARADLALKQEGPRKEIVDQARSNVEVQRANLDLQRYRLAKTELKAPSAGIVLTRIREVGAVVQANTAVMTVSVIDPVWVRAYVDGPNLGRAAPGTRVTVTTDASPGHSYNGSIGFVSPTAEFTPKTVETPDLRTSLVYRVRVIVDNPDASLRQGMPATVTLDTRSDNAAPQ